MSWLLIGVILLVAFGPVLWLVPSKKDKRLSTLRARARAEGLVVELKRIVNPDPRPEERVSAGGRVREAVIECASYGHGMRKRLRLLPGWRLIRSAGPAPDPFPDWQYDQRPTGDGRRYLARMLEPTQAVLAGLPGDVVALEVGPQMLRIYWLEKAPAGEESVSRLARTLRDFEAALAALEAEIGAELETGDS